jgi:hypothetical protein
MLKAQTILPILFMWADTYQNIYKPTVYNLISQQVSYSKLFKPLAHVQKVIIKFKDLQKNIIS